MPESSIHVRLMRDDEALPPADSPVFQDARSSNLFYSRAWLENFQRHGVPAGDRLRFYAVQRGANATLVALLPVVYSRLYDAHPRARVLHFLQPEALAHMPLFAPGGTDPVPFIARLIEFLRASPPAYDVLRFSPLKQQTPIYQSLDSVLRGTGHALHVYRLAPEYYEATAGLTSGEYLAARSGALRERLDGTRQTAGARAVFRLIRDAEGIETGWRDYERILDANESDPDPEPRGFLPNAMRVAAQSGALRLGFIDLDGEPVAAQLWIFSAGIARCLRAWSVFRHQALALDDLLTGRIAEHLIDVDRVAELSFGALDDEFIGNWAGSEREQFGLAAFNLRTWRGIKGAARHVGAATIKSLLGRSARRAH